MAANVSIATMRQAANTSTGTQDFTVSGFGTPKAAMFIVTQATSNNSITSHSQLSMGVTDGTRHYVQVGRDSHGTASQNVDREAANDEVIIMLNTSTNAVDGEANFDSWITDGVRINWGNAPGSAFLVTVILFGGSDLTARVDTITTADSGESTYSSMGFMFDMLFALNYSLNVPSASANYASSFGIAVREGIGIAQHCYAWEGRNAGGSAVNNQLYYHRHVLTQLNNGTTSYSTELRGINTAGFAQISSAASGTDEWGFLALNFGDDVDCRMLGVDCPSSTGEVTYPVSGTPLAFVGCWGILSESNVEIINTTQCYGIGINVATPDDGEYCMSVASEDASATMDTQSVSSDDFLRIYDDNGGTEYIATMTSFDDSGMVVDWTSVTSGRGGFGVMICDISEMGGGGSTPPPRNHMLQIGGGIGVI